MKQQLQIFLLAVIIIASAGCRSTKKVVVSKNEEVKLKTEEVIVLFDKVVAAQVNYEWMNGKAEVEYTDHTGNKTSFDINIRIRKDSAIWVSIVPLLGIEVARALISRDSIQILDRIHKQYISRSINYLEDILHTPVNFEMIQAVLSANYFNCMKNDKLKSVYEESPYYILSSLNKRQVKRSLEEKDLTKPIIQDFYVDTLYRIQKTNVEDNRYNRAMNISYSDFRQTDGGLFPFQSDVKIADVKPISVTIKFSKAEFNNPQSLNFTVPEKYDRE